MSQDQPNPITQALEILERRAEAEKARQAQAIEESIARAKAREEQVSQLIDFIHSPDYLRFRNILRHTGRNVVITQARHSNDRTLAEGVILVWSGFRMTHLRGDREDEDNDDLFEEQSGLPVGHHGETTPGEIVDKWIRASILPIPNLVEYIRAEMTKIAQKVIDNDPEKIHHGQPKSVIQYRCSFCDKNQDQVRRLIAGPGGIYICNECVMLCNEIVDEESPGTPTIKTLPE